MMVRGGMEQRVTLHVPLWAGRQWLTPVILATQKAEIRRIEVRSQPRKIVCETLSRKYLTQKGLVEWLKV
jgi:hypothetical protein